VAALFAAAWSAVRLAARRSRACRQSRGRRPRGSDSEATGRFARLPARHRGEVDGPSTRTPPRHAPRLQMPSVFAHHSYLAAYARLAVDLVDLCTRPDPTRANAPRTRRRSRPRTSVPRHIQAPHTPRLLQAHRAARRAIDRANRHDSRMTLDRQPPLPAHRGRTPAGQGRVHTAPTRLPRWTQSRIGDKRAVLRTPPGRLVAAVAHKARSLLLLDPLCQVPGG
jgi:hypothetical protein